MTLPMASVLPLVPLLVCHPTPSHIPSTYRCGVKVVLIASNFESLNQPVAMDRAACCRCPNVPWHTAYLCARYHLDNVWYRGVPSWQFAPNADLPGICRSCWSSVLEARVGPLYLYPHPWSKRVWANQNLLMLTWPHTSPRRRRKVDDGLGYGVSAQRIPPLDRTTFVIPNTLPFDFSRGHSLDQSLT